MAGEIVGDLFDCLRGNACLRGDRFRSEFFEVGTASQGLCSRWVGQPIFDNDMCDAKSKDAFHSRLNVNPRICVGSGHRESRIYMDQCATFPVALSELAVSAGVTCRRYPCVQEIRAEREHVVCVFNFEVRYSVLAEHLLDGSFEVGPFDGFIRHVPSAEFGGERLGDHAKMASDRVGDQHHRVLVSTGLELAQLEIQPAQGVSPAHLFVLARSAFSRSKQRAFDSVWVIQVLQAALTTSAVLAHIDRIIQIALDFFGSTFHDSNHDAFACAALSAQCRVPVVQSRHQVFRHLQRRFYQQLLGGDAARQKYYGRRSGAAGQSQKLSSCEGHSFA